MAKSRWISDLHWVRPGQQTRSQKTQGALLDAAEELFFEKGAEATSVADIAARAGCSVGSVYHHFRDKQALLYALYDRMSEEFQAISQNALDPARWEGASIFDILRGYLEFSLALPRERPGFKRSGLEATHHDPALRDHFAKLKQESNQGLKDLMLARAQEIGHPNPDFALSFVIDQLSTMLATRNDKVLAPHHLLRCSDETFIDEAIRSACAYLQIPLPDEAGKPQ